MATEPKKDTRRKWICDASPLILLAKVQRADLLPALADELVIPEAVAQGVDAVAGESPARQWLQENGQRHVRSDVHEARVVAGWDLGPGESAVLSWAYNQPHWIVVIDDLAGRRCAEALDISMTGTGVVLLAKEEGLTSEVKPILEALVRVGLRANDALLRQALRLAGE